MEYFAETLKDLENRLESVHKFQSTVFEKQKQFQLEMAKDLLEKLKHKALTRPQRASLGAAAIRHINNYGHDTDLKEVLAQMLELAKPRDKHMPTQN